MEKLGVGSRKDTKMASSAWPAWEDNPSQFHSHQKMFNLRIKFWLSPNAPTRSLWINHSSFCCKDVRKGACGWHEEMGGRPNKSLLTPLNHLWPPHCREYLRVTQGTTLNLFPSIEKVCEKKQGMSLFLREYPCSVVQIRQAEEEVARELLERSRDEWEANHFSESFGEL